MKPCPPQVLELVEHLRHSGTGEAKLKKLVEIGSTSSGAEEFLAEADKVLSPVTMAKVRAYISSVEALEKPTKPEKPVEPTPEQTLKLPTDGMNAKDAITFIATVEDKATLELIKTDERVTVQEAATKRLEALST
jgi:hypothetical protein